MPVPMALSIIVPEAEYMRAYYTGAILCHLRKLIEFLGCENYNLEGKTESILEIILVDNQAAIRMSKNYKITSKNCHIARRWHFVCLGVQDKLFTLPWILEQDQLADDYTKTQAAPQSFLHF